MKHEIQIFYNHIYLSFEKICLCSYFWPTSMKMIHNPSILKREGIKGKASKAFKNLPSISSSENEIENIKLIKQWS